MPTNTSSDAVWMQCSLGPWPSKRDGLPRWVERTDAGGWDSADDPAACGSLRNWV